MYEEFFGRIFGFSVFLFLGFSEKQSMRGEKKKVMAEEYIYSVFVEREREF